MMITPASLHAHYPTRKKLLKFKKRWLSQHGFRFHFYIVEPRVALKPIHPYKLMLFHRCSSK